MRRAREPQVGRRGRGRWLTPPVARNRAMRRAEAAESRRLPAKIDRVKAKIRGLVERLASEGGPDPERRGSDSLVLAGARHRLRILTTRRARS